MTDDGQVVWEDPAPASRADWDGLLRPLMEQPGRWARVREVPIAQQGAAVAQLRKKKYRYPAGRWEFTSRRIDDARVAVYARYLGPEDGGS
jgi:hypothetical protein